MMQTLPINFEQLFANGLDSGLGGRPAAAPSGPAGFFDSLLGQSLSSGPPSVVEEVSAFGVARSDDARQLADASKDDQLWHDELQDEWRQDLDSHREAARNLGAETDGGSSSDEYPESATAEPTAEPEDPQIDPDRQETAAADQADAQEADGEVPGSETSGVETAGETDPAASAAQALATGRPETVDTAPADAGLAAASGEGRPSTGSKGADPITATTNAAVQPATGPATTAPGAQAKPELPNAAPPQLNPASIAMEKAAGNSAVQRGIAAIPQDPAAAQGTPQAMLQGAPAGLPKLQTSDSGGPGKKAFGVERRSTMPALSGGLTAATSIAALQAADEAAPKVPAQGPVPTAGSNEAAAVALTQASLRKTTKGGALNAGAQGSKQPNPAAAALQGTSTTSGANAAGTLQFQPQLGQQQSPATTASTAPSAGQASLTTPSGLPLPTAAGTPPGLNQATAGAAAEAARALQLPQSTGDQVATSIHKAVDGGKNSMSLKLNPAELGRIDVKLEVAENGALRAVVSADRPETLDLLQRDSRVLERSLQDAGVKTDSQSLAFDRGGSEPGGKGKGDPGTANASGNDSSSPEESADASDSEPAPRSSDHNGTLDISV